VYLLFLHWCRYQEIKIKNSGKSERVKEKEKREKKKREEERREQGKSKSNVERRKQTTSQAER
tara:strand:- start:271 stop:459 length:189 start_codon:yes stop_codon:yes gene_type:complete